MSHYEVLDVPKDAPEAVIKTAYRRLAKKLHPDRPGGSQEKFVPVQKAYDTLMDPAKRARYDKYGEEPLSGSLHEQSMNTIAKLIYEVIDHEDIECDDLVEILRGHISNSMKEIPDTIAKVKVKIVRLEAARKRFRKKGDGNIFEHMTTYQVKLWEQNIRGLEQQMLVGFEVLKMLEDYSYDTDLPPTGLASLLAMGQRR